jgi:hypothetical protein
VQCTVLPGGCIIFGVSKLCTASSDSSSECLRILLGFRELPVSECPLTYMVSSLNGMFDVGRVSGGSAGSGLEVFGIGFSAVLNVH